MIQKGSRFFSQVRPALKLVLMAGLLSGCVTWFAPPAGIGHKVAFSDLPDWEQGQQAAAWPALLKSCDKLAPPPAAGSASSSDPAWDRLCRDARALTAPDDAQARAFFEAHFRAHRVNGDGTRDGLITGYYEPVLNGSFTRSDRYRYPLYRRPDNLVTVDLASLYPELRGKPLRGRLQGNRLVPYFSRAEIGDGKKNPLAGNELLWVEDPVEAFVVQVQGSGRVRLPDGSQVAIGYADQNGYPYRSLGSRLIELGAMKREDVTLTRIRDWLTAHPEETESLLNSNPSYIFFTLRDASLDGPLGALGVALTPERSVAVDPAFIPLGVPVWLDTTYPDGRALQHLAMAQDTGGAIKGAVRADLFLGQGGDAGRLAGEMKQAGRLYVLLPRQPEPLTAVSHR
jgi:membrane-bound lytic murein transglycosylase A